MTTEELLAIKYGAMLTLEQAAPFFGCTTNKSIKAMAESGKFPVPITTLEKPFAKQHPKVILVEHLAPYIDEMGEKAKRQFKSDHQDLAA